MTVDTQLFYLLNSVAGQSALADRAIVFFANDLAYALAAVFVALLIFSVYSKREKGEMLIIAGLGSGVASFVITPLIRFFYHHPRPFEVLQSVHQLLAESSWSFPSRHAAFFFALAAAVYLYNKKLGVGFFAAALFMGAARVMAGVHYPSDIVGGALVGVGVVCIVSSIVRRIASKEAQKSVISTY
jgi:undecaprenyl-diphosphatase